MNVGLIARSEDRGLGIMTWAFWRHMRPAKTMLIALAPNIARGFPQHHGRYRGDGDTYFMPWDGGHLDEISVRRFLDGLDVVYTAETFYDPRIPDWCRDMGVASVQHVMPEFHNADLPQPTKVWLPTTWRAELFDDPVIVPVPIEAAPVPARLQDAARPLHVLHIAGHRAMADRNGTLTVLQALRLVRQRVDVTVVCQDRRMPTVRGFSPRVTLRRELGTQATLDDFYDAADVVVLPRRYGGLCMPAQEALAHGCALVMPDVSPNCDWPIIGIPASFPSNRFITTAAGDIPAAMVEPRDVAAAIDALAADRDLLADAQREAERWARDFSWEPMRQTYEDRLHEAVAAL